jgi:hypothetical protein
LPFFHTRLTFDFVFAALIFAHQFGTGRLFIQYDRLFWFLVVLTAATCSLLLNFQSSMLASYALFVLLYFLFTVSRRATPEQYQDTLQGFQFLVLILSCLGICQYLTKFIVDPGKLAMFFGIFPSSLLPYAQSGIVSGQKINGIFLVEAATMSQIMALGVLIEILRFRRPRYLLLLTLALLLAYTGTGLTILLIGLPLAFLMNRSFWLCPVNDGYHPPVCLRLAPPGIQRNSVQWFRAIRVALLDGSGLLPHGINSAIVVR